MNVAPCLVSLLRLLARRTRILERTVEQGIVSILFELR
jgi:hypothetical protein